MVQQQKPQGHFLPPEVIFRNRFNKLPSVWFNSNSDDPFGSLKSGGAEHLDIMSGIENRQLGMIAIREMDNRGDVTVESVERTGRRTPRDKGAFLAAYLKLASILEVDGRTLVSGLVQTEDSHRLWRIMEDSGVARLDEAFFDAKVSGSDKKPRTGRFRYYGGKFSILPSDEVDNSRG